MNNLEKPFERAVFLFLLLLNPRFCRGGYYPPARNEIGLPFGSSSLKPYACGRMNLLANIPPLQTAPAFYVAYKTQKFSLRLSICPHSFTRGS